MLRRTSFVLSLAAVLAACAPGGDPSLEIEGSELPKDDLSIGEVSAGDLKADGVWGSATECKAIPDLPALGHPRIVVSLHGLTLHLSDPDTGFDAVYPIGPGAIDNKPGSFTEGESLSHYPISKYQTGDYELRPATNTACKVWWTDPDTKQKLPVFAGLPFMSWSGSYAIHGPIDNYRAANGGSLRRGFVSHGCIRMEAAAVLAVYARIRSVARVPVHVQREAERDATGARIDVPAPRLGSSCDADGDCAFSDGFCKHNAYSERGFCSARCTKYCNDMPGQPASFCVADAEAPGKGMCLPKESSVNQECRPLDHFVPATRARLNQPAVTARVCVPGSPGWIGDHCFADGDCRSGNVCRGTSGALPGLCTQACSQSCPDAAGFASTFCANEPTLGGVSCLRQCTLATNASECAAGTRCVTRTRYGSGAAKTVCVPE